MSQVHDSIPGFGAPMRPEGLQEPVTAAEQPSKLFFMYCGNVAHRGSIPAHFKNAEQGKRLVAKIRNSEALINSDFDRPSSNPRLLQGWEDRFTLVVASAPSATDLQPDLPATNN